MKEWFAGLSPRERALVTLGAIALAVLLVYALLWSPVAAERAALETALDGQRAAHLWMQSAASEIRTLQARGGRRQTLPQGQSLLGVVDASARSAALSPTIKRMEPQGQRAVRLWIEGAEFNGLITWLAELERRYGVRLESITLERAEAPGRVDGRVALRGE